MDEIIKVLKEQLLQLLAVAPSLIKALAVFVLGWILANFLAKVVKRILSISGVDALAEKYGGWESFYTRCKDMPETERIALYQSVAKLVAERHGYSNDGRVSRLNNRTVFKAGADRGAIYLALDTLHGTFEVCNYRGQHLKEYNFAGKKLEGPDKSGGHDLNV